MKSNIPQAVQAQTDPHSNDFYEKKISVTHIMGSGLLETTISPFSFAVGLRPNYMPVLSDLERHGSWLIGGIAGSGKTTFIHSMITCMMYRASPDELRFAITSMKSDENLIFGKLPHLLQPVITTANQTMELLEWAVEEMVRRYRLFSTAEVLRIKEYNAKVQKDANSILPQIVIIIDELKEVMALDPKQTEDAICKIGLMGKSAGIHLFLSTQHAEPSVITAQIKAHIEHRIAFRCASELESNLIIDTSGAEHLCYPGSLLYRNSRSVPVKLLSYYTNPAELPGAISCVAKHCGVDASQQDKNEESTMEYIIDELLFLKAVDLVLLHGSATVSMLQRELKLNYATAAALIDVMEERCIVGPFCGDKPRDVLISEAMWWGT